MYCGPDRELLIDVGLHDALVHALVVTADQDQVPQRRETPCRGLIEQPALCGEQHDVPGGPACGADRARQGLWPQDHSGAAAIRRIVGDVMFVRRVRADVVERQLEATRLPSARDDALRERAVEHAREEREHIDAQGRAHPASS